MLTATGTDDVAIPTLHANLPLCVALRNIKDGGQRECDTYDSNQKTNECEGCMLSLSQVDTCWQKKKTYPRAL
eukprot:scaffold24186_cov33-Prasinocladus_malaysianus.AAC.1